MTPSSDNEGAPRNGTAGRESLRNLPEHENIVEHFYDPEDQGSREKPIREKTPFSLIGNLIFLLTIAILAGWFTPPGARSKRTTCPASAKGKTPRISPES